MTKNNKNPCVGYRLWYDIMALTQKMVLLTGSRIRKRWKNVNLIFDVGNVLVEFQPALYLKRLFTDHALAEKMHETVFKSLEWLYMDLGIMTHREAIDVYCAREPEFKPAIYHTMQKVNDMFIPLPDTIKLLPTLKGAGHKLYYLSNIHKEIRDFLLTDHDYFDLFDGGVFSCDINAAKPSPEIYRHLIEKYRIVPENSIFFDDVQENVSAAEKEGIESVLFTTADCVTSYL